MHKRKSIPYEFKDFFMFLKRRNISNEYINSLVNSLKKCVYLYSNFDSKRLVKNVDIINGNRTFCKATRLLVKYLFIRKKISKFEESNLLKLLKPKKTNIDNYVPSDEQVYDNISLLKGANLNYLIVYKILLFSGIRLSECEYLIENRDKLKVIKKNGFVKIETNYIRNTKRSFFIYLPRAIYDLFFNSNIKITNVSGLQTYLKRNKLIALKYCRKWFYTKCVELGIPESIADFYEGRTSGSIGSTHYLGKIALADKFYVRIVDFYEKR